MEMSFDDQGHGRAVVHGEEAMTPDPRGFVHRCYVCRHSMNPDGSRLSRRPLTDGEWDFIAVTADISDGVCNLDAAGERERFRRELEEMKLSKAVAA